MSKQKSNFPGKPLSSLKQPSPLLMSQKNQLIDSLTSHISLYTSNPTPNPNPNPRASILKWFSSLTPHQRQSHLTAVDPGFVRILVQMLGHVDPRGHCTFIILPDLPSPDNLPSLCCRRSRGLLSRVAESDAPSRLIFESARLFSSNEGDNVKECSVSLNCLDSVTVGEELVRDFDLFVETMDGVSKGEFLRGEVAELGEDWVELGWLKAKGYYSISAFVANRLEVALRLAWLSCNSGKKRGVKLKEKVGMASASANVFWRKKGCLNWWRNLDDETRRKVSAAVMGKSAKNLCLAPVSPAGSVDETSVPQSIFSLA
ncbi:hypothetical protein CRG98_027790 [Punica granatum]|uniref:Uncharacterized protein n=1 Tax=Punica granatum TaxID=22663 RepID=A0A2I0J6G1_PUNGR|nr:hypothetical protein CRG98_027790 [Punica granatum]